MLDKLNNIQSIDKSNFFSVIKEFPLQIEKILNENKAIIQNKKTNSSNYKNILFCGMGGSAIGGDLLKSMIGNKISIPIIVNRDYILPNWVNNTTLIILSSYSGNTEEIISCYDECIIKEFHPIIIASNGKLLDNAKQKHFQYGKIPKGLMPRAALGYSISILFKIFNELKIIKYTELQKLIASIEPLKLKSKCYSNINDNDNSAIALALKIFNKFNIIYTSSNMEVVGMRFRAQLAENAKILSSHFIFPEQNHNEIEAFKNIHINGINILWIYDSDNHKKVLKRMNITSSIVGDKVENHSIEFKGDNFYERELKIIYFLDWVSFYCAIFNNTDPNPIDNILKLKSLL